MCVCRFVHILSLHPCSTGVAVQFCVRTCSGTAHFPAELLWLQRPGGVEGLCFCPWLLPSAGSAASRSSWACATTSHLPPLSHKFCFLGLLLNSAQHSAPRALLLPPTGDFCLSEEGTDAPSEVIPVRELWGQGAVSWTGNYIWARFLFSALKIWHADCELPSWRNSCWQILRWYFCSILWLLLAYHVLIMESSCQTFCCPPQASLMSHGLPYPGQPHKHFSSVPVDWALPEVTLQSCF